jgi:MFS transporter, Spinster family, sphingosine-1-phosphate transporter
VDKSSALPGPDLPPDAGPATNSDKPVKTRGPALEAPTASRFAWSVLVLFVGMHVLDTANRWLLLGALSQQEARNEITLSEDQLGWLSTVLLLGLAGASVPIGFLVDRLNRPRLLAIGVAVWSMATVSTGLARSYDQLQVARALVGAGGAAFTLVALTMLMDLFPRRVRARVLAIFYLAVPVGVFLGLSVGAALASVTSGQTAFLAVGAPGLLLALLALTLRDPVRGLSEGIDEERLRLHERVGPSQEDYVDLMVNSSYTYSVFGLTFSSFALAGLVYWSPTFLTVAKGLTEAQADSPLSLTFLGAAVLGTVAGGWLADWALRSKPRALFVVPGLAMLFAIPSVVLAIYGTRPPVIFGGLFVTEAIMFMNVIPCFTIISTVVMPNMRAVACGAALAAVHLLGDIWSPTLMHWLVDTFGQRDSMATPFGNALAALGAVPVTQPGRDPENLTAGMLAVVPALLISGSVLLAGARHLPREMALMLAKLRAAPRPPKPKGSRSLS